MAPHFTPKERDTIREMVRNEKSTQEILARISAKRAAFDISPPTSKAISRAKSGVTFRQRKAETRGRHRKLNVHQVRSLNKVRKDLIKKAKGEKEVHWVSSCVGNGLGALHPSSIASARWRGEGTASAVNPLL
jgi:hypothetical protein